MVKEVGSGGTFLVTDDTLDYMYDAWYPKITNWNRPAEKEIGQDYEYVIRRANEEWKRRLADAPETMLEQGVDEALDEYVKQHTQEV